MSNSMEGMNDLIKCNPCDVAAYKKRGALYNSQDQYEKAIEDFTKAIELNPSDPDTYIDRGTIYRRAGKQDESIKDHTKALGLIDSDNIASGGNLLYLSRAYMSRSYAYSELGDEEQYRKDRLKYKALSHPEDYYNEYAEIFIELGNLKRAMNECNKNVGLHPDDPRVYIDRARVYAELGKYEQAIFDLNEAIEIAPENGEAYYFRAVVYQKVDNKESFIRDMVLAAKNGYKQAQDFLAEKGSKENST